MSSSPHRYSPEEYAARAGALCPACGGNELDRAPAGWPEDGLVTAWVACESCRTVWQEQYVLAGYSNLEPPDPVKPTN